MSVKTRSRNIKEETQEHKDIKSSNDAEKTVENFPESPDDCVNDCADKQTESPVSEKVNKNVKQNGVVKIKFNNASSGSYKCNHCKEVFENPLMLLRHKREAHIFPRKILPLEEIEKYYDYPNRSFCPICKKAIKTNNYRSIFVKHLLTHTVATEIECVICKKKFTRKDHMLNHQKRHIVPIEDFIKKEKPKS